MKRHALFPLAIALTVMTAQADPLLVDDFDSYTNGDLVGQGGWTQTGTATASPIQVLDGDVLLTGGSGAQDAYSVFLSTAPLAAGSVLTSTITFTLTSAPAGGDYFFHLSSPAGTTSNFYQRLHAKSSGAGFVLGLAPTSGAATYGTLELSLATEYTAVITWSVLDGANNDTFELLVDGTSYLAGVTFVSGEPTSLAAANFRQGSTGAPIVSVSEISVDIAAVPEPGTVALMGLGVGAILFGIRRRLS